MAKAKVKKKKDSKKSSVKKGIAKVSKGIRGRGKSSARQSRLAQIFNPAFNVKTTREAEKVGKNVLQENSFYITGNIRKPIYNAGTPPRNVLPLIGGSLGERGFEMNRQGKIEVSTRKGVDAGKTDVFNVAFSNYLRGRKQSGVKIKGKTYKADIVKDNVMLKPVLT